MSDANKPQDDARLQVDADWKAQARAEKEKLAQEVEAQQAAGGPGELPEADFKTLVSMLVSQALLYMGAIPADPATGQRILHPDMARHNIDLLAMLEEKTKGNLDEEDKELLSGSVVELRQYFVQLTQQLAAQRAKQGQAPPAGAPGAAVPGAKPQGGAKPPGGGIIMP